MGYNSKLSCPIQRTITLIADKWKLLVIRALSEGTKRFGQLQRAVEGVTPTVLTRHLRDLEADGIVKRTVYAEVPPRVEYELTPVGMSLLPVLKKLNDWAVANADSLLARREPEHKPAA